VGELTAVAVWGHKPSPDELLDKRLRDGWRPTATPLQTGPAILGHAACLARREGNAEVRVPQTCSK
jgi:hypothetical protein